MNYEIGSPNLGWLMLAVPLVLALLVYSGWARRRAFANFGAALQRRGLIGETFAGLTLLLGIALLVVACMDIRWGKTSRDVPQRGLEVVFALDVSRSMLAEDAKPNRLARAKQQINDMVDEMVGDRIGLVVFAGEAIQASPLTNHYTDFRQKLETIGPDAVSRGGSQLGLAISEAADAFISKTNDHRTIILFTDGEDQESRPIELAKELHAKDGTRVFTVGLGDIGQGARIPDANSRRRGFVEHQGKQVWSKLNGSVLQQIATATKAVYIPAGTKRVNMADIYHSYIANVDKAEFEVAKIDTLVPRFQWFAAPAFVCLFFNLWMTTRPSQQKQKSVRTTSATDATSVKTKTSSRIAGGVKVASFVALACWPVDVSAQESKSLVPAAINASNELIRDSKFEEAIEALGAVQLASDLAYQDELNYGLATAHYRNADLESAAALFEQSARSANVKIASDSRYNLGNCYYAKSLPKAEEQAEEAIKELEVAITYYRSALRLDRQRGDARENIERARKLIKKLKSDQEKEKEKQDEQNQDDPEQNDTDDSQSEQQQQNDQEGDQEGEQEGEQEGDSNSESESDSEAGSQGDDGDKQNQDETENEASEQSQQEDAAEQASDSDQSPQQRGDPQRPDDSKEGKDPVDTNNPDDVPNDVANEAPPEGELSAADPSGKEAEDTPAGSAETAQAGAALPGGEEDGLMTKQEALKLLQAVRDRDMLRRLRQQQIQRQRRVRVDKDW